MNKTVLRKFLFSFTPIRQDLRAEVDRVGHAVAEPQSELIATENIWRRFGPP